MVIVCKGTYISPSLHDSQAATTTDAVSITSIYEVLVVDGIAFPCSN